LSVWEERRLRFAAGLLALLLRAWAAGWRVEEDDQALRRIRERSPSGGVIYAFWHNRMIMLAYTHRRRDIQVLRSSSRDGRLIAELLLRFGYGTIAGSSSRGGSAALRQMLALGRRGLDTGITVDGPRGPRGRLKAGALQLAALSGNPIVPICVASRRGHVFGSWDRSILPWPLSRLHIRYGEPLFVPRDAGKEEQEILRRKLEDELRHFSDGLDVSLGREPIPPDPADTDRDD